MDERERVKVGMAVVDAKGRRLGKVTRCDPWGIEVTHGFWSPSEWVIRWDELLGVERDEVRVARGYDTLMVLARGGLPEHWRRGTPPLTAPSPGSPTGYAPAGGPAPGEPPASFSDPHG